MSTVFIIHGTGGSPEGNWFPWLQKELEKCGFEVIAPRFPTPEKQTLDNWFNVFQKHQRKINHKTIFIGHSLGSAFVLRVLERMNRKVRAVFLVAGFIGPLGLQKFDPLNKTFAEGTFDWGTIRKNCKNFYVINSDDDPYVPLEKGEFLAENLDTEVILMKGAKHINADSGFTTFEFLLDKIHEVTDG